MVFPGPKFFLKRLAGNLGYEIRRKTAPGLPTSAEAGGEEEAFTAWPDIEPEAMPCHFQGLFVNSNGDVFPCCSVWSRPEMRIGHLDDPDLPHKVLSLDPPDCACAGKTLRAPGPDEEMDLNVLNLEMALACQAQCAMCCVEAPDWRGTYDCYESLERLIDQTRPREILVQGGEILLYVL